MKTLIRTIDKPLRDYKSNFNKLLELLTNNATTRDTLDMMMNRCEYVGDLAKELEESACRIEEVRENLQRTYQEATRKGLVPPGLAASVAAIETTMLIVGMIRSWSLADETSPMRVRGRETFPSILPDDDESQAFRSCLGLVERADR